jgi:hypothetical protein
MEVPNPEHSQFSKTDARVEGITQSKTSVTGIRDFKQHCTAISVLRRVKLFGWEKNMSEKLQRTQDDEQ